MARHQRRHGANAAADCGAGNVEKQANKGLAGVCAVIDQAQKHLFCRLQPILPAAPDGPLSVLSGQTTGFTGKPNRVKLTNRSIKPAFSRQTSDFAVLTVIFTL